MTTIYYTCDATTTRHLDSSWFRTSWYIAEYLFFLGRRMKEAVSWDGVARFGIKGYTAAKSRVGTTSYLKIFLLTNSLLFQLQNTRIITYVIITHPSFQNNKAQRYNIWALLVNVKTMPRGFPSSRWIPNLWHTSIMSSVIFIPKATLFPKALLLPSKPRPTRFHFFIFRNSICINTNGRVGILIRLVKPFFQNLYLLF